jgi:pyruvate/2-oxoglutarate dehydrogenase complex dihydrolipoamide acyltransferase (E2) component
MGRGIGGFQPLLFPQQTAIVGISDGHAPGTARLTLGFDHRVANGSQGAAFLAAVEKELLE